MTSIHSLAFLQVGSLGVDYTCLLSDQLQINMKQTNKQRHQKPSSVLFSKGNYLRNKKKWAATGFGNESAHAREAIFIAWASHCWLPWKQWQKTSGYDVHTQKRSGYETSVFERSTFGSVFEKLRKTSPAPFWKQGNSSTAQILALCIWALSSYINSWEATKKKQLYVFLYNFVQKPNASE